MEGNANVLISVNDFLSLPKKKSLSSALINQLNYPYYSDYCSCHSNWLPLAFSLRTRIFKGLKCRHIFTWSRSLAFTPGRSPGAGGSTTRRQTAPRPSCPLCLDGAAGPSGQPAPLHSCLHVDLHPRAPSWGRGRRPGQGPRGPGACPPCCPVVGKGLALSRASVCPPLAGSGCQEAQMRSKVEALVESAGQT